MNDEYNHDDPPEIIDLPPGQKGCSSPGAVAPVVGSSLVVAAPSNVLAVIERAARDPNVDVGKMAQLLELAEKVQGRLAQTEYDAAMNAAQAEMRPVAKDSENPQTRSRYASYEAMDGALRGIYTTHGFSLSFGTRTPAIDRIVITCRVSHRAGHTERVEIEMPADGKGARGNDVMTKTHATGSAVSYGMRYLLKMIFNVSVGEYDDDGNAAGGRPGCPQGPPKAAQSAQPALPIKIAPRAKGTTAKTIPEDWVKYLAACKARLLDLIPLDDYWAWWRFGVDSVWILPFGESLADAEPGKMFAGYDRANPKPSVLALFELYRHKVEALKASCGVELRNEILRAAVPLPTTPASPASPASPAPASPASPAQTAQPSQASQASQVAQSAQNPASKTSKCDAICPLCKSTTTRQSEDYEAVTWCQNCGHQWDSAGKPFEAHDWAWVVCPIPPKGTKRADYLPQTLGELSRIDNKRFIGLVLNNTEAKARAGREWQGKHYPGSKEDILFGAACEKAKAYLDSKKQDQWDNDEPDTIGGKPF